MIEYYCEVKNVLEIRGIGISGKKGTGSAYKFTKTHNGHQEINKIDIVDEEKRYEEIIRIAKKQISQLYEEAFKDDKDSALIFQSHMLLADDTEIKKYVKNLLSQGYDLLSALSRTKEDMKIHFLNMQQEIFRTKVCDIEDTFSRLMFIEEGKSSDYSFPDKPFILVCDEIIPSVIYQVPKDNLKGIIVRFGSNCSHGAILARIRNIPVIIRLKNRIDLIKNNDKILMNGESGAVFIFND